MHFGQISDNGKSIRKKSRTFFNYFLDNTLPVRFEPVFLSFIEPELAITIISFLKPGVAGGIPVHGVRDWQSGMTRSLLTHRIRVPWSHICDFGRTG
jgi:hypothetical protein